MKTVKVPKPASVEQNEPVINDAVTLNFGDSREREVI